MDGQRTSTQVTELRERFGGLPSPIEAQGIWRNIWLEEAHHSTALEGNTLVLRQVEQLLEEGRAVGNKELREYMEVRGYATAANWLYDQALEPGSWAGGDLVTLTELRYLHGLAMGPVWDVAPHPDATQTERPGSFREHDIQPFPGGMEPPPWPRVHEEVSAWIEETTRLTRCEPLALPELLAALHVRFEQIHPFLDGNGRTGRLALNLLLIRLGYPPAIIYKRDRGRYLTALRRADGGLRSARGAPRARDAGQPLPLRRPRRGGARTARAPLGARVQGGLLGRAQGRGGARTAKGDKGRGRDVAQLPRVGGRVRRRASAAGVTGGAVPARLHGASRGRVDR